MDLNYCYLTSNRPLTCNIQKRESSVTTTTILTEIPTSYATYRGSNGALQMTSNPRAVSPLMVSNEHICGWRISLNGVIWQKAHQLNRTESTTRIIMSLYPFLHLITERTRRELRVEFVCQNINRIQWNENCQQTLFKVFWIWHIRLCWSLLKIFFDDVKCLWSQSTCKSYARIYNLNLKWNVFMNVLILNVYGLYVYKSVERGKIKKTI